MVTALMEKSHFTIWNCLGTFICLFVRFVLLYLQTLSNTQNVSVWGIPEPLVDGHCSTFFSFDREFRNDIHKTVFLVFAKSFHQLMDNQKLPDLKNVQNFCTTNRIQTFYPLSITLKWYVSHWFKILFSKHNTYMYVLITIFWSVSKLSYQKKKYDIH